jgi:hypothetical protein
MAEIQGGDHEETYTLDQSGRPGMSPDHRGPVSNELHDIRRRAQERASHEQRWAKWWSRLYFLVGLPAAILAAIAGAVALASTTNRVAAGVIALISAGLTAAATFLDSGTRRGAHENLAAAWQVLGNDAHIRSTIDINDDDWLRQFSRLHLQDLLDRERKLLQGKAPDAEAEAERRAQTEAVRAQEKAVRAEAEAERARAAEQRAQAESRKALLAIGHLDPTAAAYVLQQIERRLLAELG